MKKIQIKDGLILINSVEAKWPWLTKKHPRYKKYTMAIDLEADAADILRGQMQLVYSGYLDKNPESVDLPLAPFCVELDDGRVKFELQNRQKPELLNPDGTAFEGKIGQGSIVRLVVQTVPFSNARCGVSLRVRGVEVTRLVRETSIVRELFGHQTPEDLADEPADSADEWEFVEIV